MTAEHSVPAVWPWVAIVLGVCGLGLAFLPFPAGPVAAAAGLIGVVAGVIALVRDRQARALTLGGIAVSVVALVVASLMTRMSLGRELPMDNTDYVLSQELEVSVGKFAESRLPVTLTNKLDVPATYSIAVGGYRGDSTDQIHADQTQVTLAGGADQQVQMFTNIDKSTAERLQGADFRVIGAWSQVPERNA